MELQNKSLILRSFKFMHIIIFGLTLMGMLINFKLAAAGLFILFIMLLNSEIPVRRYLKGKPIIIFGCTASEATTKEDTQNNLKHHLIFIALGFIAIVINFIYLTYSHFIL